MFFLIVSIVLWSVACLVSAFPKRTVTPNDLQETLAAVSEGIGDPPMRHTSEMPTLDYLCCSPNIQPRKNFDNMGNIERWLMYTLITGIVTSLKEGIHVIDAVQREFIDHLAGKVEAVEHDLGLHGSCTDYISSLLYDHASTWASHPLLNQSWAADIDPVYIEDCVSYVVLRSYALATAKAASR